MNADACIGRSQIEEIEMRQKGELIYTNYQLIKEILEELNKASKKHSWKESRKTQGHKYIKELNDRTESVILLMIKTTTF